MRRRRVAITGWGTINPLGLDVKETWNNLLDGKSGVGPISRFDASSLPVRIAGEVKGFDPSSWLSPKDQRKMGLFIQYALHACREALVTAGLPLDLRSPESPYKPTEVGVSISSGMGSLPDIETWSHELRSRDKKQVSPFFVPMIIPNMASGQASLMTGAQGPNLCIVSACASSAHSLGEAARSIAHGYAEAMIVGGAEAVVSPLGITGFASMKALSTRNEDPERASRPYDKHRDGFVLSEGAAILILESWDRALAREASILGEIVGYGANADAYHMTTPSPQGEGAGRCMELALGDGQISLDEVAYVNSHGTSTPSGDAEEAQAIARVFSPSKKKPLVSSSKSMTGHLLGATGAFEALVCLLALRQGIAPPTINLGEPDEISKATGLDFCANEAKVLGPGRYALSNSFGFGGTNATLVFGKAPDDQVLKGAL